MRARPPAGSRSQKNFWIENQTKPDTQVQRWGLALVSAESESARQYTLPSRTSGTTQTCPAHTRSVFWRKGLR